MVSRLTGLLLAATLFVSGCASTPQPPVSWQAAAPSGKAVRIGVAMTALPKPDTYFPGAGCLLCLATASIANSSLTAQVKTWTTKDLETLREALAAKLREQGLEPVVIAKDLVLDRYPDLGKDPNRSRKDFSALRTEHQIDKLLVLQIDSLGVTRNYAAYISTGDPRATVIGSGYIVNLGSQALEWYLPLNVSIAATEKWDEPPKFPGLTNAYFQALETAMDQFKQPFSK